MMIYVGTSGYSYNDWIGPFYAEGILKGQMLKEYAKNFKFTEINFSYYSMPNRYLFFNMVKNTPEDFKFTVKLHSSMTHSKDAEESAFDSFNEALKPLMESQKLGCLLAQFPYSFHASDENLEYIRKIKDNFRDIPICVEFRNDGWMKNEVYEKLAQEGIGFVCVDEPDIKGLIKQASIVTSKIGYVRFHGRNRQKWYDHNEAFERYDYLYSEEELKKWIPRILHIDKNTDFTFIAFNNHFKAKGAVNATMLQKLLEEK